MTLGKDGQGWESEKGGRSATKRIGPLKGSKEKMKEPLLKTVAAKKTWKRRFGTIVAERTPKDLRSQKSSAAQAHGGATTIQGGGPGSDV